MKVAREEDISCALPPPCPEVIIIGDEDNDIDCADETGRKKLNPILWTEISDNLLLFAQTSTVRHDDEVVSALLRKLGIAPTTKIRCSLQETCEKLGHLLDFVRGHERRHRACEDLVLIVGEVLRLVQTVSYKWGNKKEASENGDSYTGTTNPMDLAYGLMDRWGEWLLQCARSSDDRSFAMGLIISRLETISLKFSDDIENFQKSAVTCEQQLQNTAEEWLETLKKCRRDVQSEEGLKPFERDWKVFDKTFNTTEAVQLKFEENNKTRKALMYHVQEKKLRYEFYCAALTLVYAVTELTGIQTHEQQCVKDLNMLKNDMMVNMTPFCGALRDLMTRSTPLHENSSGEMNSTTDFTDGKTQDVGNQQEIVTFAKNVEAFWLIHRNWFPPRVLDLVIRCFSTLRGANGGPSEHSARECCPISCAISRVCVALGPWT